MELTAEEARVLGCLIEKSYTTPDHYPLTTNALVSACNQKSSRDPVVSYSARDVDEISRSLRELGLVRIVRGSGMRTAKHKQVVAEATGLGDSELALLAVLLLRGPQAAGELKTRTERYVSFEDLHAVEQVLEQLSTGPGALVVNVGRGSGQSQDRWRQMLTPHDQGETATVEAEDVVGQNSPSTIAESSAPPPEPATEPQSDDDILHRLAALEQRVGALEREWAGEV